jgi:hypothetical protein
MIEDFDVGGVSLWELGQVESILSKLTVARDSITFMNSFEFNATDMRFSIETPPLASGE